MSKQLLKDSLFWGFILWLIGYTLGIALFFVMQALLVGWAILPIGTVITFWVLLKKVKGDSFLYFLVLSVTWTLLAIILDYIFLVKMIKPADGYYKADVYLYYALTFIYPLMAFWLKARRREKSANSV